MNKGSWHNSDETISWELTVVVNVGVSRSHVLIIYIPLSLSSPEWIRLRSPCRSLAVGSGSMMCRVGSVVAPFCVYLADVWIYLPQVFLVK